MPSTYTSSLRLTLPQTGDLVGTWGNTVNTGITSLVDQAVAGTVAVTMLPDTNYTLSTSNGASDEARNMFISVGGGPHTGTTNVICPSASKMYVVTNNTSGGQSIVFKTAAGTGPTIPNGVRGMVYCDGTNAALLGTWGVSGDPVLVGATSILGTLSTTGSAVINGALGVNTNSIISTLTVNGNMAFSGIGNALYYYYFGATNFAATASTPGGDVYWSTGTTGVAERMRLTNNGLLGINTPSPAFTLDVWGGARIGDPSSSAFLLNLGTTGVGGFRSGYLYGDGTNMQLANQQNGSLSFYTNNTQRLAIDSSGTATFASNNLNLSGNSTGGVTSLIYNSNAGSGAYAGLAFWNNNGFSSLSGSIGYKSSGYPGNQANELFIANNGDADVALYRNSSEYIRLSRAYAFKTLITSADLTAINGVLINTYAYSATSSGSAKFLCVEPDGSFTSSTSTRRIKTDIQPLTDASFVMALNPVTYKRKKFINGEYIDTPLSDEIEYGFIAEEVAEIDSRLATYEKVRDADGNVVTQPDGVAWLQLVAPAIRFVQQLKNEFDAYRAEAKNEIDTLRAELNALKGGN